MSFIIFKRNLVHMAFQSPVFYLIILFLLSSGLLAQDSLPPVIHYNMLQGLSQMKTTSIVQDHNDYIWVGTRNGLNRFDGKHIVSYFEEDGLLHNRIHALAYNAKRGLVVLTYKGLSFFNGKDFISYPMDFIGVEYRIKLDPTGGIWIFGINDTHHFNNEKYRAIPDYFFSDLVLDKNQSDFYLIGKNGLYKEEKNGFLQFSADAYYGLNPGLFISNDPFLLMKKNVGNLTAYCSLKDGKETCYLDLEKYQDKEPNSTLYYQSANTFEIKNKTRPLLFKSNPFIRVVGGFKDKLNNYWLADENGFAQVQHTSFTHFEYDKLPYVWTITQDAENKYWASSYGNGVFSSIDGQHFQKSPEAINAARTPFFLAASTKDSKGNIYLGNSNGILQKDTEGFRLLLKQKPVYALVYDKQSNHLIAGGSFGVAKINLTDDSVQNFGEPEGLHQNDYIQNLSIDNQGNYWAGSYNGVSKILNNLSSCENLALDHTDLNSKGVFCSISDPSGIVWLGGDKGLLYYSQEKDSIVQLKSDLLQSMVKSLCFTKNNKLLIGAKDGLFLFDSNLFLETGEISIQLLNRSTGFLGLEPGFTGFFTDVDDQIWICSASSVDRLDQNKISQGQVIQLKSRFTHINGDRLPFMDTFSTVSIPRGISNVDVRCDAIGMIRPKETKFKFKLDDNPWTEWLPSGQFIMNDLSNGLHHIKLRAGPSDTKLSEVQLEELSFIIDLPLYKRKFFPLTAFSLVIILLLLTSLLYIRQRWENRKYINQLKQSKYLRSQLLLSELNPHFIFNILSSIQHKVLLGDRDTAASYIVKLSKMIRNFLTASHHSHTSIDNYRENDISLKKELDLLHSYLEFEQIKSDHHFEYHIDISPEVFTEQAFVPPMLIQPFVENAIKHGLLLSPEKGELKLKIYYLEERLCIQIEDNGVGREKAAKLKQARAGHVSLGTVIIDQRIDLLNQLGYDLEIKVEDIDPRGTCVYILLKE